MKKMTTNEIRKTWLEFWKEKEHTEMESSNLVPENDPTLLWINSGVAALKKYFDGSLIPTNKRIVNSQKCIRTNDIENVGITARHHTFFEMLGNFSIGDYFRKDVLPWAYELLTSDKYFGLDITKLFFTVYPDDEETYEIWKSLGIKENQIIKTDYNFWEIGEGPCGPCTEIFFDRGNKYGELDPIVTLRDDIENDRFIEIWNIVFSQYNSEADKDRKEYKELPFKNIDTGSGLERLACVMQEVETNYETDTFVEFFNEITKISNIEYKGQKEFKVIADHVRTITFAVSDGALLSNEGRGYVLRRLLRRAVKMGRTIGVNKPFLFELVETVIKTMGEYYPDIEKNKDIIKKVIKIEEEKFLSTIAKGEDRIKVLLKENKEISGSDAFLLYDTFGFPIELTVEYAEESNKKVDLEGFNVKLEEQKQRARSSRKDSKSMSKQNEEYINFKENSEFIYDKQELETTVIGVFEEGVVLKETPVYALSGGQISDKGTINNIEIKDVIKLPNKQHLHIGEFNLSVGDKVVVSINNEFRSDVTKNHSATHVMYKVLREVLGDHVSQQGSNVTNKILRFDFNNFENLSDETICTVETKVNEYINKALEVNVSEVTIDKAKEMGATAEFGEKYDNLVRVVNMGNEIIDLCGGTHIDNTKNLEQFSILSISSIGSGIFRLEATTNDVEKRLEEYVSNIEKDINDVTNKFNNIKEDAKNSGIELKIELDKKDLSKDGYSFIIAKKEEFKAIQEKVKKAEKEFNSLKSQNILQDLDKYESSVKDSKLILKEKNIDKKVLKDLVDALMDKFNLEFIFLANEQETNVVFVAKSKKKELNCGQIVKLAATVCNGNGGGRPDFAQAGGKDVSKIDEAISQVTELI